MASTMKTFFFSIQCHQGCLERREWHPGGVQQEKLGVMFWTCGTFYNPFLWHHQCKIFFIQI